MFNGKPRRAYHADAFSAASAGVEPGVAGSAHVGAGGQRLGHRSRDGGRLGAALAAVGVQLSLQVRARVRVMVSITVAIQLRRGRYSKIASCRGRGGLRASLRLMFLHGGPASSWARWHPQHRWHNYAGVALRCEQQQVCMLPYLTR